jgi:hypothetical protein
MESPVIVVHHEESTGTNVRYRYLSTYRTVITYRIVEATNEILPPERALRLVFMLLFLDCCWPAGRPDLTVSHTIDGRFTVRPQRECSMQLYIPYFVKHFLL